MVKYNVTTAFGLPNFHVVKSHGIVRGITVRSRSVVGNFFAAIESLFGGNITLYAELCERAREDAYELMCDHAMQCGANAIIGVHYESNEVMAGITEVLCYGTAVTVEPVQ